MNTKIKSAAKLFFELLPLVLSAVFLFLCVFLIGHFKSYTISPQKSSVEKEEAAKSALPVTLIDNEDVPFITDVRTIAEHQNGIGVFNCFGELLEVYEINLDFLPTSDRHALKEGISFDSEGEMRNFLESLDS
ncbi:MAG: hypothetical protein E7656_08615 [Ruminococcaceae bacterium]|nr:hypothetical protein [Oscillospiraceae bacterium]